ncbi:atherin-like, partial [Panicum hallii]|uniref:atherin-like n=1 Tax=Panicum hallii TaxID=206008 RepID=UPI000DF4D22D
MSHRARSHGQCPPAPCTRAAPLRQPQPAPAAAPACWPAASAPACLRPPSPASGPSSALRAPLLRLPLALALLRIACRRSPPQPATPAHLAAAVAHHRAEPAAPAAPARPARRPPPARAGPEPCLQLARTRSRTARPALCLQPAHACLLGPGR